MNTDVISRSVLTAVFAYIFLFCFASNVSAFGTTTVYNKVYTLCENETSTAVNSAGSQELSQSNMESITFSITILPVHIIEISSEGNVHSIWSNVQPQDCKYSAEFVSSSPISSTPRVEKLEDTYERVLSQIDGLGEGYIYISKNQDPSFTPDDSPEKDPDYSLVNADCGIPESTYRPDLVDTSNHATYSVQFSNDTNATCITYQQN